MQFKKITEQDSNYNNLEEMSTLDILMGINKEDQTIAEEIQKIIPKIEALVEAMIPRFLDGGRIFYLGAGTSGRLGIVDASEIPPTFGMPANRFIGLIAGGESAIRKAKEFAEDDRHQAWKDITAFDPSPFDTVIGISASGTTPYVVSGVKDAKLRSLLTAGITNNPGSPLSSESLHAIEIPVGPEFVTGSTRMKSGTSQKLILNMISTSLMIRIGRVKGNKMVHMQLSNQKLVERGIRYVMTALEIDQTSAAELLKEHGSVSAAVQSQTEE
ncbi:MAG: N-acetylmuramic acid 6-phosphate etherase [Saprospiraceae bacterium]|nr:N-acetylmuramic acid 6-phosphate etherase [Saprospiraceae bacterium]